ncbi:MAG: hypothetical protein JSR48_08050 [Verrucomicrobia bacterium]|nr:hypothetical protein [Verrucomicrobiota bacterium]
MPRPFILLTASLLLAPALWAADAASGEVFVDPAHAPVEPEIAATTPAPKAPHERKMSDQLAATLAVGMPKYQPPKPPEKKVDQPAELRDEDKPRNGIIRLPDYVVREKRPPVFKEKDLATTGRKTDLGMKRYAGLNFGPFASLNRPIALAMYQEQERLDNMSDLADDAQTARRSGDKQTANFIMKQSQETYMRRDTYGQTYGISK